MIDIKNAIKDAVERQIGNGDWNGISVEDGRYEANMESLDIDSDTIEVEDTNLDSGVFTIVAGGTGSATYKDANSQDVTDEYDVKVRAKVNIGIIGASIQGVVNDC